MLLDSWREPPSRLLALVVPEAALLLIVVVAWLLIPVDKTPHPERVTASVDSCDLSLHGAAQISFSLTNGDRYLHGYQVQAVVASAQTTLGAGTSLVTHVNPGDTVHGRMLVQANGDLKGAACSVLATVWEGQSGHHG